MAKLFFALPVLWLLVGEAAHAAPPKPPEGTELQPLTASRGSLRAGETITVTGYGCTGGDEVRFELFDPLPASSTFAVAQSDGTFVQLINVPTSAQVGRAWLRASCSTPESQERILQAVLLITRPAFLITWVNVFFGLGTSLIVGGFLVVFLRGQSGRGSSRRRSAKRRKHHRSKNRSGGPTSTPRTRDQAAKHKVPIACSGNLPPRAAGLRLFLPSGRVACLSDDQP